ncbi:MAG TPA: NAD(P)/FAD-dependent oxidoreductase [Casimicrobiaceae bacterium]|nr:NAD(P)/FAD-dependent oxidoreductase [Casimicrobiaceae bacterium]
MIDVRPTPYKIVIIGGGAGGLPLAASLGHRYRNDTTVEITLVDRVQTHVWKPLLHEVAAGRMDADAHDVDYPALAYRRHFKFRQGAMTRLDRAKRIVHIDRVVDDEGSEILPVRELRYDMLVIAVGSVSNDFGVAGVAEHTIAIDTPVEAERFHRRLLAASVRADAAKAAGRDGHVDVVIIGAGATGVELAAEIRQTTRTHAAYGLDHLDPQRDVRITIIEAANRILPPLPERIADAATALLDKLAVTVRVDEKVVAVDHVGVHTQSGAHYPAQLIVWAAGIRAPAWLAQLDGLEANRANQLVVTATLQTTRDADVFAFGDCAACPWIGGKPEGAIVPPRAQAAYQQAKLLVRTVKARREGKPLPQFRFRDYGSLVSLGELSAVGTLMGNLIGGSMLVQGLIARAMYASLYKLHQRALYGSLAVVLDTIGRALRGGVEPRVKLH